MVSAGPLFFCFVLCSAFALPERDAKLNFNIDEEMAPKSFSFKYYRYPTLSSAEANFDEETLDFDVITPTLVFGFGTGDRQMETIVKWHELRNSFTKNGKFNFNDLVSNFPGFKNATKLVIISHGWSDGKVDSCDDAWVSTMARTIRENDRNVATIALCWNSKFWSQIKIKLTEIFDKSSKQSGVGKLCLASVSPFDKIYFTHAATTGKVGEFLASILKSIKQNNQRIFIHGIGHSLGAHIMGNIFNFGGLKLDRITGLDPAGPCFEGKLGDIRLPEKGLTKWGLNADAAEFVDNYHTDGKHYGTYSSMGDMDFFIGEVDEDGVSDISSQPTCFTCKDGCCHNKVREYFTESIVQKDHFQTAYPSNFVSTEPNGTTWVHQSSKIDNSHGNSKMYAGYHAEKPTSFPKNKRMFLPMFNNNNNYDEYEWAAVCDLENLREKEKDYCVAQGSKMISSSTGPNHSTHSTTHSSQALHTTSSIRPGTTRSTFWIGSAATTRSTTTTTATTTSTTTRSTFWIGSAATTRSTTTTTATTTSTTTRSTFWIGSAATTRSTTTTPATTTSTTTRSTFWIGSAATTRSTTTTTATTTSTTTRSIFWIGSAATTRSTTTTTATTTTNSRNLTEGNFTSSDGRITVHYREEQARSKERKVSFRCKNDVVKSCFVNKDTYKIWGKGYTKPKADYYSALAKGYADSNCDSKAVFGPDYCIWDRKQC